MKKMITFILIIGVIVSLFAGCSGTQSVIEGEPLSEAVPLGGYSETEVWASAGEYNAMIYPAENGVFLTYDYIPDSAITTVVRQFSETTEISSVEYHNDKEIFYNTPFHPFSSLAVDPDGNIYYIAAGLSDPASPESDVFDYFIVAYPNSAVPFSSDYRQIFLGTNIDRPLMWDATPTIKSNRNGNAIAVWHGYDPGVHPNDSLIIYGDMKAQAVNELNIDIFSQNPQRYFIDDDNFYYIGDESIDAYDLHTGQKQEQLSSQCAVTGKNNDKREPGPYYGTPILMGINDNFYYYIDSKGVNRIPQGSSLTETILDAQNCLLHSSMWQPVCATLSENNSFYILYYNEKTEESKLLFYKFDPEIQYKTATTISLLCLDSSAIVNHAMESVRDSQIYVSAKNVSDEYSGVLSNNQRHALRNSEEDLPLLSELHAGNAYLQKLFEDGNAPDVIVWDASAIMELGSNGYLLDLAGSINNPNISSSIANAFSADQTVYAVPLAIETSILYGDPDISIEELLESDGSQCYLNTYLSSTLFSELASLYISNRYNFTVQNYRDIIKTVNDITTLSKRSYDYYGVEPVNINIVQPYRSVQSSISSSNDMVTNVLIYPCASSVFYQSMKQRAHTMLNDSQFVYHNPDSGYPHPFEIRYAVAINANTKYPEQCVELINAIISDECQTYVYEDIEFLYSGMFGGLPLSFNAFETSMNESSKTLEFYGDEQMQSERSDFFSAYIDFMRTEYQEMSTPMIMDYEYIYGLTQISNEYFTGACSLDEVVNRAVEYTDSYSKF